MTQNLPQKIELLPPFPRDCALNKDSLKTPACSLDSNVATLPTNDVNIPTIISHVPGDPSLSTDPKLIKEFLERELKTPLLDQLYKYMWFFTRASGRHIDPLHSQSMRGRELVPMVDPKLHLVWKPDVIYLKPVPECLFNYDFWIAALAKGDRTSTYQLENPTWNDGSSSENLRSQAIGFLRSYAFLIQHRVDFEMAKKAYLIPEDISWACWATFISHFRDIEDWRVSNRYHFGQIRLSRLHWLVFLTQPDAAQFTMYYELPYLSIWSFMNGMLGPFAFLFAIITVVLTSMQLLTASKYSSLNDSHFEMAKQISWSLAIAVIIMLSLISVIAFLVIPMFELLRQLRYSLLMNKKRA